MKENNWKSRTGLLIGEEKLKCLSESHILVVGLGGVGGYAAEQLVRSGIGRFTLIDCDLVHTTNRNRQIIALLNTEGLRKTDLIAGRMKEINPEVKIQLIDEFLDEDNIPRILGTNYDYIIDAIDTLGPKVALLAEAVKRDLRVISSFGSGGRTDPDQIRIADISESHGCKFGYRVRKALHARQIREGIKVVFSPEKVPPQALLPIDGEKHKRSVVGTISYMPAIFGCLCAAEIIKEIIGQTK